MKAIEKTSAPAKIKFDGTYYKRAKTFKSYHDAVRVATTWKKTGYAVRLVRVNHIYYIYFRERKN